MSTFAFSDLLKKAHETLANLRGGNFFAGKNGEVLFSKNNELEDEVVHTPGYLTIHCQTDDHLSVTLILQWLSNTTLSKNPARFDGDVVDSIFIRCVSPRGSGKKQQTTTPIPNSSSRDVIVLTAKSKYYGDESSEDEVEVIDNSLVDSFASTVVVVSPDRPNTLTTTTTITTLKLPNVPSINLIPHTPVECSALLEDDNHVVVTGCDSDSTSGADELSDKENGADDSSSCDDEDEMDAGLNNDLEEYSRKCESLLSTIPEQFAKEHNLMFCGDSQLEEEVVSGVAIASKERVLYQQQRPPNMASLFTVNLGKMRSMRIFYSDAECASGQLVIASPDSRYKILHFHHGGLDKLAQLFEQWNAVKSKSVQGSPSPIADGQLLIYHPELSRDEMDPEENIYDMVNFEFWKSCKNADGSIDDSITIRKAIFFASISPSLRREIWPFLLRVYPFASTLEQREAIRNDLFLQYQDIKRKMMRTLGKGGRLAAEESSIMKDVVRTDRRSDFFSGDDNPNLEVMRSILLNYAVSHPHIAYSQGMSDLLSPLLITLRDETLTYWCFVGLIEQSLFRSAPPSTNQERSNMMDINLEYLRQLLKSLVPDFYCHLENLGGDAMQLMFVHRWLLLCFKREFHDTHVHIWEACFTRYRTSYFHLFIAVAIVSIYGSDVVAQALPNDELLLYFSSLTGHMDVGVVMRKARGLLHSFYRMPKIPCTLAGICEMDAASDQWSSHLMQQNHIFECTNEHPDGDQCPFAY